MQTEIVLDSNGLRTERSVDLSKTPFIRGLLKWNELVVVSLSTPMSNIMIHKKRVK